MFIHKVVIRLPCPVDAACWRQAPIGAALETRTQRLCARPVIFRPRLTTGLAFTRSFQIKVLHPCGDIPPAPFRGIVPGTILVRAVPDPERFPVRKRCNLCSRKTLL